MNIKILLFAMLTFLCDSITAQESFSDKLNSIDQDRNNKKEFATAIKELKIDYADSLTLCEYRYKYYKVLGRFYFNVLDDNAKAVEVQRDSVLPAQLECLDSLDHQIAITYFNIGLAYEFGGDLIEAEKNYQNVLYIENKAKESHRSSYHRYSFIADFYRRKGDIQKAKFYLQKARNLCTTNQLAKKFLLLLQSEARLLMKESDYTAAALKLNQLLDKYEENAIEDLNLLSRVYEDLALCYRFMLEYDDAARFIDKAIQTSKSNPKSKQKDKNRHYLRKSYILKSKGDFLESKKLINKVEAIYASDAYNPSLKELSGLNEDLADVYFEEGNFQEALSHYQYGINLLVKDQVSDVFENPVLENAKIINLEYLRRQMGLKARCLYEYGDKSKDIKYLNAAIQTFEKYDTLTQNLLRERWDDASHQKHLDGSRSFYNYAILSSISAFEISGDKDYIEQAYGFTTSLKSKLLARAIKIKDERKREITKEQKQEEDVFKNKIRSAKEAYQIAISKKDDVARVNDFNEYFRIKNDYDFFLIENGLKEKLKSEIIYDTPSYFKIQNKLNPEEAILEYHFTDDGVIVFLITKDDLKFEKLDFDTRKIETCYNNLINGEAIGDCNAINFLVDILNNLNNQHKELIIIADGPLLQIPFEILRINNQKSLIERFNVSYQYASKFLFDQNQVKQIDKLGAFASNYESKNFEFIKSDLDYLENPNTLIPLKYAIQEVEHIGDIIPSKVFLNESSTKEVFLANLSSFEMYHFALHGILNNEFPDQSGIVFNSDNKDFLLTASEIYDLELNSKLTVLSACNSGSGPILLGEGTKSLTRSFLHSGSEAVLTSLWSASDASTVKIISDFYTYLKKGHSKSSALKLAKRDYLKTSSPSFQHPKYWAHLILVGDLEAVSFRDQSNVMIMGLLILALILLMVCLIKMKKVGSNKSN